MFSFSQMDFDIFPSHLEHFDIRQAQPSALSLVIGVETWNWSLENLGSSDVNINLI